MILETNASTVETNIPKQKTKKLSAQNTTKLFSLLSQSLYSNAIGSMIRELACNCKDSHIQANNSEPFEIHLPSKLDPTFRVKDYGTGMSKDQIDQVYNSLGTSTKTTSNEFIGAFGIGSKTPFAYTADGFIITSIQNNEKCAYSVYIDSDGDHSITELYTTKTDEPNGFEVMVAVEEKDIYSFQSELKNQLKYFDFNYKVDGELIEPYDITAQSADNYSQKIIFNDDECLVKTSYYSGYITVIFGGVYYTLNTDYKFFKYDVILKFDIGELDVSASRETIAYTEKTIENIHKKIEETKEKLTNKILIESEQYTRLHDLKCWLFTSHYQPFHSLILDTSDTLHYRYISISKYDKLRFYYNEKKIKDRIDYSYRQPRKFKICFDSKVSIKKVFNELGAYSEIIVMPNYGLRGEDLRQAKIQINQLLIDVDSEQYIEYFSDDEIKEINSSISQNKQSKEIEYSTITSYGNYSHNLEFDYDSIMDNPDSYVWVTKYKNRLVDENDEILFNNLDIAKSFSDNKKILCFTKTNIKKLKQTDFFDKIKSFKEHVVEFSKEVESKSDFINYKCKNFVRFIKSNVDEIDNLKDSELKELCNKDYVYYNERIINFLSSTNWTGILINTEQDNRLIEKYGFVYNKINYCYDSEDKKTFTKIVNYIHKEDIK